MTTKEKANAYDEAVSKMKEIIATDNTPTTPKEIGEYLFSELKENKDEEIKKEIINYFKCQSKYEPCRKPTHDKWITWLEKQGEQNLIKYINETWKDMRLEVYQQASGNRHEPNYSDNTTKMFSLNDIDEIIEKMSEQKSVDKVEPKFEIGDWIVSNTTNLVYRVDSILCKRYYLSHNGEIVIVNFTDEQNYRHWTINDAKDGDVLAAQECYVIFKEIAGLNIKCYCTYHYMGFNPSFHINTLQNKTAFHPATKEQRDLLFATMKEEGYEWDAEKKVLKEREAEQKLAHQEVTKVSDQETSEWSEKDDKMLEDIVASINHESVIEGLKCRGIDYSLNTSACLMKDLIVWLKSLKPQKQWKPTQEQMKHLAAFIEESGGNLALGSLYEQLKKLYYDTDRTN